jgi:hypothetical protein
VFLVLSIVEYLATFLATPIEMPRAGSDPMDGRSDDLPSRSPRCLSPISVHSVIFCQLHEELVTVLGQFCDDPWFF